METASEWMVDANPVAVGGLDTWHKWRAKGLGSSDMPVVMGVSPYKQLYQLWLEKTGKAHQGPDNWAMKRGKELEADARRRYNEKTSSQMVPGMMVHAEHEFARASFDGIDTDSRRLLEIKCPGKMDHAEALLGRVPEHYWPQVQWLLFVAGYEYLDYVSWDGENDIVIVPVQADPGYQKTMLEKARWFWNLVQTKIAPENTAKPVQTIEDPATQGVLKARANMLDEVKKLTARIEDIDEELKLRFPEGTTHCGEFKIDWIERKGNVDYAKIPALKGVDLEPFRKAPSRYLKIT